MEFKAFVFGNAREPLGVPEAVQEIEFIDPAKEGDPLFSLYHKIDDRGPVKPGAYSLDELFSVLSQKQQPS